MHEEEEDLVFCVRKVEMIDSGHESGIVQTQFSSQVSVVKLERKNLDVIWVYQMRVCIWELILPTYILEINNR